MTHRIKSTRFWFSWIVASVLVYPLAIALFFLFSIAWTPVAEILLPDAQFYDPITYYSSSLFTVYQMLYLGFVGAIIGWSVGVLQKAVVRRHFRIELSYWRRVSTIGGLIAAPVMLFTVNSVSSHLSENYTVIYQAGDMSFYQGLINILPMTVYVSVMSFVQLIILRKFVKHAWLWIGANAVAGFMFSMVVVGVYNPGFGDWLLAAIAQGAVTGFAMLWLLHRLNRQTQEGNKQEFAYQYVPIEDEEPRDPSVWDDAF